VLPHDSKALCGLHQPVGVHEADKPLEQAMLLGPAQVHRLLQ